MNGSMQRLEDLMNRNLEEMRKSLRNWGLENSDINFSPSSILVDVEDRSNYVLIKADIPGMDKENIDVHVSEEEVEIKAESTRDVERSEENFYFHERGRRKFHRRIRLPVEVEPGKVKASYRNGVLRFEAEKKEEKKKKKVKLD